MHERSGHPAQTRFRRITALTVSLAAAVVAAVAVATPASADELSNTQTMCTEYTDGQVWQTSMQWGRARQRLCVEFTNTDARAHVQFQTDWPSNCELSAGLPRSAEVSCPTTIGKLGKLTYKEVHMPISWTFADGTRQTTTCDFADVTAFDMSDTTLTCDGAWFAVRPGAVLVGADGISADVQDDGDGLKALPAEQQSYTWS